LNNWLTTIVAKVAVASTHSCWIFLASFAVRRPMIYRAGCSGLAFRFLSSVVTGTCNAPMASWPLCVLSKLHTAIRRLFVSR